MLAISESTEAVGRMVERRGALEPALAGMLAAALDHPAAPMPSVDDGAPMPPLWHWAAFPEFVPMDEIGHDGHPKLGRFLPALPLERRMWAGGRLCFEGVLRIGEPLHRRSEILAVDVKEGAGGAMVFVRVGHRIEGAAGAIEEEQDIVYLPMPDRFRPPKPTPAPKGTAFGETVAMDTVRLFRFSAATYNAHRIHYDLPYATEVERYPALVVHGPMQAALLIEAACRHTGRLPRRFIFRGVHPMFHDHALRLVGETAAEGDEAKLCTAAPLAAGGHCGLVASIGWA
ncbi:MAG: MaoC family dehydratase N-terminal domain-containing protein [Pseudomonadota bacterium]